MINFSIFNETAQVWTAFDIFGGGMAIFWIVMCFFLAWVLAKKTEEVTVAIVTFLLLGSLFFAGTVMQLYILTVAAFAALLGFFRRRWGVEQ